MSKAKTACSDAIRYVQARVNLYRFLAGLYASEPDVELLHRMRSPSFREGICGFPFELDDEFHTKPIEELREELAAEFTRLFLGPGKHISPHESVHREGEGLLWGDSTATVKALIEYSGLQYRSDFTGIPDHISAEFEFMARLAEAEATERENNHRSAVKQLLEMQNHFLHEHLLKWIPQFVDLIIAENPIDFYLKTAQLTKEVIFQPIDSSADCTVASA